MTNEQLVSKVWNYAHVLRDQGIVVAGPAPATLLAPVPAQELLDADRAIVGIHDIGFVPVIRDGVKGFRIVVGGGSGHGDPSTALAARPRPQAPAA